MVGNGENSADISFSHANYYDNKELRKKSSNS